MKVLRVVTLAQYLTAKHYSDQSYNATKFVKGVKGETFKGYAKIPVCGRLLTLEESDPTVAISWAAEMAAPALAAHGFAEPVTLVPMPSSKTVPNGPRNGRAHLLAKAMLPRMPVGSRVADVLSFKTQMVPSHQGGTRVFEELLEAMLVHCPAHASPGPDVIIVDDVLTTGSHFLAAWQALTDLDWHVSGGFAVGRSHAVPEDDPFAITLRSLYHPSYDPFADDPVGDEWW